LAFCRIVKYRTDLAIILPKYNNCLVFSFIESREDATQRALPAGTLAKYNIDETAWRQVIKESIAEATTNAMLGFRN